MKFLFRIKFLTVLFFWIAPLAHADFYFHPWMNHSQNPGPVKLNLQGLYLSTSSNFSATGSVDTPTTLGSYSQFRTAISGAKNIGSGLTAYARGTWSVLQVSTIGSGTTFSGSTFGLADQSIGLAYKLIKFEKGGGIDLQAQFDFPGYNNSQLLTRNQPFLGDGSTDISVGGFAQIPVQKVERSSWAVHLGAGYTNRTDGFSAAIPYSVFIQNNRLDPGLIAQAGVYGIQSLGTDTAGTKSLAGTGGSMMSNAVNPSVMNGSITLGYQVNTNLLINGQYTLGLMGKNAPKINIIGAGITYTFGTPKDAQQVLDHETPKISTDAIVMKSNDRLNVLKINQGSDDGIKPGMIYDIYAIDLNGKVTEVIAVARVTNVKSSEAALEVTNYIREVIIDEGFIARRRIGGG
ncbi:MAG: hypothetical protein KA715_12045 [Xanthomonadaceae bacterium]|nr:hypothetical protein [Xanthomonadaceae bacterium]